ncbi:hypothetical protein Q8004_05275 [Edwardsiella piscicida]|nr:hypothetical protein Q8004_05275 [Edwardsiella piscicida]
MTALLIALFAKGYKTQPVLFLAGFLLLLLTALFDLGPLLPAKSGTGAKYFDIFKVFSDILSSRLAGLGLMLMAIAGFSRYMEHVGASMALLSGFRTAAEAGALPLSPADAVVSGNADPGYLYP